MSLTFLGNLSAKLEIELSEPTEPISERLANVKASPAAVIKSIRLRPEVFENGSFREPTTEELDQIALQQPEIQLRGHGEVVTHRAPNGASFSVRELLAAVEETERQTRGKSSWFGGVDVHHVFFEGIEQGDDGVWKIFWGS